MPSTVTNFETCFLTNTPKSVAAYQKAIATVQSLLVDFFLKQKQPYNGATPKELTDIFEAIDPYPIAEREWAIISEEIKKILNNSVVVSHPTCIAHLHCPPLIPALAAEMIISATNQSMDSWDQSPAATIIEQKLVNWLCSLFGYQVKADGVFTSGGTQSNFMGLLLARDYYCQTRLNWSIQQQGLPQQAQNFRILCSTVSHFTVRQAAVLLGLGEKAIVPLETDENYCLSVAVVEDKLRELKEQNLVPIAIVATAGTTDFGSIDPLDRLADCARKYGAWLHVDAAYGGALILSDRHRDKLAGIELADSLAVDFHKLFYQPISCGVFLLKDRQKFRLIELRADYLNPESNEVRGIPDLVTKSVQTTRRFDALKLFLSLQSLGEKTFAEMIDSTIDLAEKTAKLIAEDKDLELANYPTINAVVFRYLPQQSSVSKSDEINRQIRTLLMEQGKAVIAQTQIYARTYLKFTLLNPRTTISHIVNLLAEIKGLGKALENYND